MRSLGFKYHDQRYRAFDAFVSSYPAAHQCDFAQLAQAYVSEAASPSQRLRRTSVVRALANALSRAGRYARPLAWDAGVDRTARALRRRPVVLSEQAVRHFLDACERLPSPHSPLRPWTLKAMAALAYCAGLRLGELVRLRVGDVDLRTGTLDVRETKFFKSRRLPLHASVSAMLRDYLAKRCAASAPSDPEAPLFWSEERCAGYTLSGAEEPLAACLAAVGLRAGDRRSWARPHDLRRTFVVHRLTRWYREGVNPQDRLPYLATYLGHRDINSTLVYITVTRELLQQACVRLRPLLVKPLVAKPEE
jgi:integrase